MARGCRCGVVGFRQVMPSHPATLYGFVTGLVALIGVIVLVALNDVSADVAVPIIASLGAGGVGVAGGVAVQNRTTADTGTVTLADPSA